MLADSDSGTELRCTRVGPSLSLPSLYSSTAMQLHALQCQCVPNEFQRDYHRSLPTPSDPNRHLSHCRIESDRPTVSCLVASLPIVMSGLGDRDSSLHLPSHKGRKYRPTSGLSFAQLRLDGSIQAPTHDDDDDADAVTSGASPLSPDAHEYAMPHSKPAMASGRATTSGFGSGRGRTARYGSAPFDDPSASPAGGYFSPNWSLNAERVLALPAWCPCLTRRGGGEADQDDAIRLGALGRVARLSLPSTLAILLGGVCMLLVNVACVGHIAPAQHEDRGGASLLAGVALGASVMMLSGFGAVAGLCSCIDTLCSQAHGAAKHRLVGLIAQRVAVAYTISVLPIVAAVWLFTEPALVAAGQDPALAALAGAYTRAALPCLAPLLYSEVIRRYLLAQTTSSAGADPLPGFVTSSETAGTAKGDASGWVQIVVALLANVVHAAVCIGALLFSAATPVGDATGAHFGPADAAGILVVGQISMLLLWLVYLLFINRRLARKTCPRPMSTTACARLMRGWGPIFRLGLPGLATGAAQAMALMLVLLAAGWIRKDDDNDPSSSSSSTLALAALVVLASLASLGSAVAAGVGVAAGNMVADRLGAGKAQEARHVARAAVLLAALLATIEAALLLGWPRGLAAALSSNPSVQNSFTSLGAAPALIVAADMLAGVQGGVLRGLGLQAFSAHATLAAYAFIGAPLGLALAFPMELGARGLAWGLVGAAVSLASLYGWHLYGRDWEHECALAVQRIDEEEGGRDAAEMLANEESDLEDEGMADMRREHGFGAH